MRARSAAVASTALLLALLLPADLPASADVIPDTVVDVIDGLPGAVAPDTGRARSLEATAPPVRTPIAFSMLAVTAPPGATVRYRTSRDGRTWTPWSTAETAGNEGPDPETPEASRAAPDHRRSGEPMWVGEAEWMQARVSGAEPGDVRVDLIDPLGLSRSVLGRAADAFEAAWRGTTAGVPAQADTAPRPVSRHALMPAAGPLLAAGSDRRASPPPAVVTRAQWGADESLRSGRPVIAERARYAVLHHTVNTNAYSRAQAPAVVRGIYAYHTRSRRWSDIGYNYLVDRFGTIYEGRAGGATAAVVGAHARGFNTGSIGVALIGDHQTAAVSAAARAGAARLLAWQFAEHDIDPAGKVRITSSCTGACRYPDGASVRKATLIGHRQVGLTACPGHRGQRLVEPLRSVIADIRIAVLSNPSAAPSVVEVASDGGLAAPVRLTADVVPAGRWQLTVRRADGVAVHRAAGRGKRASATWRGRADTRPGRHTYTFTSGARSPEVGAFTVAAAAYAPPFSDDDDSAHAASIGALHERKVTRGCTPTRFCPRRKVSRGQMASLLARTMDHLLVARPTAYADHFDDDGPSVHAAAIDSLAETGIVAGCAEREFCPTVDVRRGDVAAWIASAFDLEPQGVDHFSDDTDSEYEWAINALADVGLTEGCTADAYCPDDATSRGQMASFLSRAIDELEASGIAG